MRHPHSTHAHSMASTAPLTSTVKVSLSVHVHSSPPALAARFHWCRANCSHYINNGWTFPRQTLYSCVCMCLCVCVLTWVRLTKRNLAIQLIFGLEILHSQSAFIYSTTGFFFLEGGWKNVLIKDYKRLIFLVFYFFLITVDIQYYVRFTCTHGGYTST